MLSIAGWWRHLRLRLTKKELILTGQCRQCGACCRRLQLKSGKKWLRSKRDFNSLVKRQPEFACFEIRGRDPQRLLIFNCTNLGTDNRCQDYNNRPQLCRDFPSKAIFFCGGQLPEGCGYTLSEGTPFRTLLEENEQSYLRDNRH